MLPFIDQWSYFESRSMRIFMTEEVWTWSAAKKAARQTPVLHLPGGRPEQTQIIFVFCIFTREFVSGDNLLCSSVSKNRNFVLGHLRCNGDVMQCLGSRCWPVAGRGEPTCSKGALFGAERLKMRGAQASNVSTHNSHSKQTFRHWWRNTGAWSSLLDFELAATEPHQPSHGSWLRPLLASPRSVSLREWTLFLRPRQT